MNVGCAVIERNGEILIAQRKPGDSYAGYWEFPGGKIREGETVEECLVRELQEELGIRVRPRRLLLRKCHRDPERDIHLFFYFCDWAGGKPVTIECHAFRWIPIRRLRGQMLLPGDLDVADRLIALKDYFFNRSTPVRYGCGED